MSLLKKLSHTFITSLLALFVITLSSCSDNHEDYDTEISNLESRISELETELEEANNTIEEYQSKFDQIQSEASTGYDAISYFNWSYELQEALDAFENIQNEASY